LTTYQSVFTNPYEQAVIVNKNATRAVVVAWKTKSTKYSGLL